MRKAILKISRRGVNVLTNKDPRDLAWSSEFIADMVVKIMKLSTGGQYTHGLGYTPQFRVMHDRDGNGQWQIGNIGETGGYVSDISVDDAKVYVRSGNTHQVYVVLLANSLERPD